MIVAEIVDSEMISQPAGRGKFLTIRARAEHLSSSYLPIFQTSNSPSIPAVQYPSSTSLCFIDLSADLCHDRRAAGNALGRQPTADWGMS